MPKSTRRKSLYVVNPPYPAPARASPTCALLPAEHPASKESTRVAEPSSTEYTAAPAWTDTTGRVRTWSLLAPGGSKMAEVTTKRDAEKLATLLNGVARGEPKP